MEESTAGPINLTDTGSTAGSPNTHSQRREMTELKPCPVGRIARFFFQGQPAIEGKVVYAPAATGDSWIIEDPQGGHLYVQTFCYMFLYPDTRTPEAQ